MHNQTDIMSNDVIHSIHISKLLYNDVLYANDS